MIIRNNKAFTLIELLIVVLIIGVLAMIAFPKYQLAVEKTRAMNKISLGTSLYRPAQEYILAHGGELPKKIEDLSINPPPVINIPNLAVLFNAHGEIELKPNVTSNNGTFYTFYFALKDVGYRFKKGAVACFPQSQGNAELAKKVCDSLCNGNPYVTVSGGTTACVMSYI